MRFTTSRGCRGLRRLERSLRRTRLLREEYVSLPDCCGVMLIGIGTDCHFESS